MAAAMPFCWGDKSMKTLYVSDLDGTLLRSDEKTSDYTNRTIHELVERGMLFSYATARSFQTSHKVTKGLSAQIPLIIYNGSMTVGNVDGALLAGNFFGREIAGLLEDLFEQEIYPIVYAVLEGEEKFSYVPARCTRGMNAFLASRQHDKRANPVEDESSLLRGSVFYVTCIDETEKLEPLYEKYKDPYHCVFQEDLYTKEPWLEIMPKEASKANAAKQLQARLGCEKLVVFGDGKNDMDLFAAADEAYAVENAVEELKRLATAVIESNDEDGVAKWLSRHFTGA